ncbi:syntrophin-like 2 isoform X2 [Arctopsyche grandis]|uniref:syntrophin-like 2 isoform X2 n=1 Tax=Arctopsyche grandis TaxID=121162 RepID=UPI00406D9404
MRVEASEKMTTPIEEMIDEKVKIRTGMVRVSDGKTRPEPARLRLSMETLAVQKEAPPRETRPAMHARERMVQITRQKVGGLGLSIKGGAEHKLPILISRIYKDQAADQTGQLFVGDAVIKVNGEYITACPHDDAVNILRNAGDLVVLTVKHYRAATPFLQKQADATSDNESIAGDEHPQHHANGGWGSVAGLGDNHNHDNASVKGTPVTETSLSANHNSLGRNDDCWSRAGSATNSRPSSVASDYVGSIGRKHWVDILTVPLMMAYVTRYVFGTDKLRPNSFEVRGINGASTGVIHCDDLAIMSQWLKLITDNIVGLTNLQTKLYNRNFAAGERIEYMGWVHEGVLNNNQPWQTYKPRFLTLKGTDVMLFDTPPVNVAGLSKCPYVLKVYQTMFRVVKESENVDWRQHCFLVQASGAAGPRYLSVETRQELLRIESAWTAAILTSVIKLGCFNQFRHLISNFSPIFEFQTVNVACFQSQVAKNALSISFEQRFLAEIVSVVQMSYLQTGGVLNSNQSRY